MTRILRFITTLLFFLLSAGNLFAQFPAANDPSFNIRDVGFGYGAGANSTVYAMTRQADGKIIIGGDFITYNGRPRYRVARLNADGTLDSIGFSTGTGANNPVLATAVQADGKIIIGGYFTAYNGTARLGIARLNADGSLDAAFNSNVDAFGTVYSILIQPDGKIIIGGSFTSYNGINRNRIARLNPDGNLDVTFNPGTGALNPPYPCSINSLAIQPNGKIIIGGVYGTFNGTSRQNLARLNADGSLDTSFDANTIADRQVNSIVVQPDGKILIGGDFWNADIYRLNVDGTLDPNFNPIGSGGNINAIALQADGKIIIGGGFYNIGFTTNNSIARMNANGGLDNTFKAFSGFAGGVCALAMQPDGKILAAGSFTFYDGTARDNVIRINPNSTPDISFNPGTSANGAINSLVILPNGKMLVGGAFTIYNGEIRHRIARLNGDGSLDKSFNASFGVNSNDVNAVAVQPDGKVIITGAFNYYNLIASPRIARLNTNGTLDASFNANLIGSSSGSTINAVAVQPDGKILVAAIGNGITLHNADGTLDTGFNWYGNANSYVNAIKIQPDGKILMAGYFTTSHGVSRNYIARLNADGTLDTSFNPGTGANNPVFSVALQPNGKIIIGGTFTAFNGVVANRIARLNADGTLDTGFNPGTGADGKVSAIAVQADGKVILGGEFTTFNGMLRQRLARLNANGSLETGFNAGNGLNGAVKTIEVQADAKIVIGGAFTSYNGKGCNRIARLNTNGMLDPGFNSGAGAFGNILKVGMHKNGNILIGGDFTNYNGINLNRISSLLPDGSIDPDFYSGAGADSTIFALAIQPDSQIIIGGYFTRYNGKPLNRIARLKTNGRLDSLGFNIGSGANGYLLATVLQNDGKILIGGNFTAFNGTQRARIARINADGTVDASFNPGSGADSVVSAIAIQTDGKITIGGNFTSYNGIARNRITRLNPDGSLDNSFNSGTGANGPISTFVLQPDGKMVIGGAFTNFNGTSTRNIARLNANGTIDASFNPGTGPNGVVKTIALQTDGKYIIGGTFANYNGTSRNRLARLNADGSLDLNFNPNTGADGAVSTAVLQADGKIIIAGSFSNYNGASRNHIARVFGGDYNINTDVLSGTKFCGGNTLNVPFTVATNLPTAGTGPFNTGNVFTVQLSNANGSFSNPTVIGTLNGISASPISATIPTLQAPGTGYRIRVVSSDPVIIGADNGVNLTVNGPISAMLTGPSTLCLNATGATITFTGTGSTAPYTFAFNVNGGPTQYAAPITGSSATITIPTGTAGSFTYNLESVSVQGGCTQTLSNAITVVVNNGLVLTGSQTNVIPGGGASGSATVLVSGGVAPYSYSWNTIPVQTSQTATGLTPGTYQVTVTDAANCTKTRSFTINQISNNADLTNLALNSGGLSPAFNSAILNYTAAVSNATSSVTFTPIKADANATIQVNGVTVISGTPSWPINLNVGANTITTVVTAQDGTTAKTYTVVVDRAIPTGVNEELNAAKAKILVYPNPNQGSCTIALNGFETGSSTLKVYNLLGKEVLSKMLHITGPKFSDKLLLPKEKGIYFLKISSGEHLISKKIVIE